MFYFFYKIIIFRHNKGKDYIQSEYVYLNFFHETVTSHNLETEATIFVPHSAMKTLVDQSKRAYYPNYFIKFCHLWLQ